MELHTWYCVAGAYDHNNRLVYGFTAVQNSSWRSFGVPTVLSHIENNTVIGGEPAGTQDEYEQYNVHALVDDVFIFNWILSKDELSATCFGLLDAGMLSE
jgi:hypothetical protein